MIRRREFITLLGGAAAAWPLAARAQQGERVRRVGVLMMQAADDPEATHRIAALRQTLRQLGWIDGRIVQLDIRHGASESEHSRKYAKELVALAPEVIFSEGSSATAALLETTRAIPVVFANVSDPVGAGYVASLARPGGNA